MTMIEKVARAICRVEYGAEDAGWENQIPAARAALEAMREPTPEMLAAFVDGDDPGYTEDWQAMIDAALAAPSPERNG